jgi:hypothetical protein|tara:strand:- start:351 stop:743 length:393 start_codon:yes stop_codon:yes gene_type:complete
MRFILTTVVDITQTNARRGDDKHLHNQQANYHTMIQTIGLRVNIEPLSCQSEVADVKGLGFGDTFKGKQRYWEFTFDVEAEDALTLDMLVTDFDLVPVITNLDETTTLGTKVFRTNHPNDTNIVFKMLGE